MIKSSHRLSRRVVATRETPEFASRGPEWVLKSPFFPLNLVSPSSSVLTSINRHQQPVSTCLLAQFLLLSTWISINHPTPVPQHSSNTSHSPFWALQEQSPSPEDLLGLEISTSKYYLFVFFSSRLFSGFTPLLQRTRTSVPPLQLRTWIRGHSKKPLQLRPLCK